MSISQSNLKVSHIEDHHIDPDSDKLYDPLRNLLINPQSSLKHEIQSPTSPKKSSNIPGKYSRLSKKQSLNIKKDIMIPVDKQLIPTYNLDKVKSKQYRIIDVKQKRIDGILKSGELQRLLKKQCTQKPHEIVYQVAQQAQGELTRLANARSNPTLKSQLISADVISPQAQKKLSLDKNKMTMSLLTQKNSFKTTDKLYQPLRKIIDLPHTPVHNMFKSPKAIKSTSLDSNYKRLTFKQALNMEKQMYIPIDKELIPTEDTSKIMAKKFRIVDAYQKPIGGPLTYQEVQHIVKHKPEDQLIVYGYDKEAVQKQYLDSIKLSKLKEGEQDIKIKQIIQPTNFVFDAITTPKKIVKNTIKDQQMTNKPTEKKKLNLTKFDQQWNNFERRVSESNKNRLQFQNASKSYPNEPLANTDTEYTPKSFYQSLGITPIKNYEKKQFQFANQVKLEQKPQISTKQQFEVQIPLMNNLQINSNTMPIRSVQTERAFNSSNSNFFKSNKYQDIKQARSNTNLTNSKNSQLLTMSKISSHNKFKATDNLYNPLRQILTVPGTIAMHQLQSPKASSKSMLNSSHKKFTQNELKNIKQQIYIPIDTGLMPTKNVQKVKNKHWRIMDASQKVVGLPISEKNIRNMPKGHKEILYVIEDNK